MLKMLEAASSDQVSRFRVRDAADQALQIFIRRTARKSAAAGLTKTYVATRRADRRVLGYVTIMCAEIKLEGTYPIGDKTGADAWEYQPAVRIARLAVDGGHEGAGLGRQLVELAIGIVLEAIEPRVGCRFLIVDAKRKAIAFYEKLGFRLLDTAANQGGNEPLMFLDLKTLRGA